MKVLKAASIWIDYHKTHSKKNTTERYKVLISRFNQEFGDRDKNRITSDEALRGLTYTTPNGRVHLINSVILTYVDF